MRQQTMSIDEIKGKPKRGKYGTAICKSDKPAEDGHTFDSKGEHLRYLYLRDMAKAGEITDLQVHPESVKVMLHGKWLFNYRPDFTYTVGGRKVIEDFKSSATRKSREWGLKRKLLREIAGIEVYEVYKPCAMLGGPQC